VIDGNDVVAVAAAVGQAAARARAGGGPALLEAVTYRHFGHSRTDPARYRPAAEVAEWLARDPLTVARERLAAAGVPAESVEAAAERAAATVAGAVAEAKAAPAPDPEDAFTDVWADGGSAWRT
jgi:acetoin:2,6-dichlorophenolindophenol oxidoreductase subunit alpha